MPNDDNKVLKYIPGKKSLEHPFIIYADLECILRILDTYQNKPEKSYTENKALHVPSGYALVLCCSFDNSKTEIMCCRGNDCIEQFCKQLRDLATKIINYEKKMEIVLTDEEKRSYKKQEVCHICREEFCYNEDAEETYKKHPKVRDHDHYTGKYRGAAQNECNLNYKTSKEIPIVFHSVLYLKHLQENLEVLLSA